MPYLMSLEYAGLSVLAKVERCEACERHVTCAPSHLQISAESLGLNLWR